MAERKPTRRRRKMQSVTMTDVARLAAVSPSTVSLYLRKPSEVSPAISERVRTAIDQLNYVPNFVAGGLASAGSRVVSIVVPSVRNAFFSSTVSQIEAALAQDGLLTLVGNNEYSLEVEESLVRAALSWTPAAIVLTGLKHSHATIRMLRDRTVPVIEMWQAGPEPIMSAVGFSHHKAGLEMANHVLSKGYRRPVFVGARLDRDVRAAQRASGHAAALEAQGIRPTLVEDPRAASTTLGCDMLARVLGEHPECDVIVCSSDVVALGIVFEAGRRNISIPGRIGLTGFGNLEFSATCNPGITTVEPNSDRIAGEVVALIRENLAQKGTSPVRSKVIDTGFQIIARDSL